MSVLRTIRTVRYLKRAQLIGQVRNRCRPLWERPNHFFARDNPIFDGCRWKPRTEFLAPGVQGNDRANMEKGRFKFLNEEASIGWPPTDWTVADHSKLWQYNLHYFEWLWALDYDSARECVLDWIARHPLARSSVGWQPYPTSLRLMNWCAVLFGRFGDQTTQDPGFVQSVWRSVYLQAEWLRQHVETHLLGNHLLENGAALTFIGSCFSGESGKRWLRHGHEILAEEIPEQFLADGMHFERSPMYHVRLTYLLQLLSDTGSEPLRNLVGPALALARNALAYLCHPDGDIALLNDSAFSIYNLPRDLLGSNPTAAFGAWALPDAGYYGWRGADGSYLICDAGPIGPDYIPGHAHGDTFSFELSLRERRVIVDSGVYDYVPGAMRQYCRSTRAHNTIEIDGQDQSEFWGAFRVAQRAYPRDVRWTPTPNGFHLSGWHDGYKRAPGAPTHHRTFSWEGSSRLSVRDRTSASRVVTAVSRLHLHPTCYIKTIGDRDVCVAYPEGSFRIAFEGPGRLSQEDSYYCPEFGRRVSNIALAFTSQGKETETAFTVDPA